MRRIGPAAIVATSIALSAHAGTVQVVITGEVEFNQINSGLLADVNSGEAVSISFNVDPDDFVDSPSFPVRAYVIDQSSFSMTLGSVTVGLQNPFPAGETPYFSLRNNDPAVDGFLITTVVDFPVGVPIDQAGIIDQFHLQFLATYGGDTLSSLDILDAVGTYDFTGLTVFDFGIEDGPFQPIGILYEQLTIIPAPGGLLGLLPLALGARRRRGE